MLRAVEFSAAYWKALGGRLKPDLDLDAIEANYHKVEDRLEKVIDGWQRDGDNPSWETLAKAVSQCTDVGGGKKCRKAYPTTCWATRCIIVIYLWFTSR